MYASKKCCWAAALVLLALSGCTASVKEVSVKDRWSETIRSYGMTPVYPMREDVFVGDLRMTRGESDSNVLGYRLIAHVPLEDFAATAARERPELPATGTIKVPETGVPMQAYWQQPTKEDIFAVKDLVEGLVPRARIVALPAVSVVSLRGGEVGASAPVSGWAAAFGVSAKSDARMTITLRAIESIEIDDTRAHEALSRTCDKLLNVDALTASRDNLASTSSEAEEEASTTLHLVTRVFYARAIEYSYVDEASIAARAAAGLGGVPQGSSTSTRTTSSSQGNNQTPASNEAVIAEALGQFSSSAKLSAPGVQASAYVTDQGAQVLKEVFERPLAFAVETLDFDADKMIEDGKPCALLGVNSGKGKVLNRED